MYMLNSKIQQFAGYQPLVPDALPIHLDANESFVELDDSVQQEIISKTIANLSFNRYPDPTASAVCNAFAALHRIPHTLVTAGNGSDELISVIFQTFLEKGDVFLTIEPDFSMYRFYGQLVECSVHEVKKREDFTIDPNAVIAECERVQAKILIFSNPCNPTSIGLEREAVRYIVKNVRALVVLDEAYMDFWDQSLLSECDQYENLIILKTCSKAIGLAGIRLGFAVANERLTRVLQTLKSPYNVNSMTQAVGEHILANQEIIKRALIQIQHSKQQLASGLAEIQRIKPFFLLCSVTNFVAFMIDNAEELVSYLRKYGVVVRHVSGFIRVSCGKPNENKLFLKLMREYVERR